ncbi:MAG TPA: Uma2 family endonuclease [Blastocatellia bacterium]|nr:Uma2 family endonuclease [Blastocatellia bacterium]
MATELLNENISQQSPPYSAPAATPLPLENGDRLTRAEFERRYHAMPELKKADDLHEKFKACRRNGINEYLVWRVDDRQIDWFKLRDGEDVRLAPDNLGMIESEDVPGLRLKVEAILNGDLPAVLSALQEGPHSESHASFVQDLAGKTLR